MSDAYILKGLKNIHRKLYLIFALNYFNYLVRCFENTFIKIKLPKYVMHEKEKMHCL